MGKKKRSTSKNMFVMLVVVIMIVLGYFAISKRSNSNKESTFSEIEFLLNKDLEATYPVTPREVVKLYSRYTKCLFNELLNDDQITKIAKQVQIMYDKELIEKNPLDEYIYDLKLEIAEYRSSKRVINSYSIDSASNVVIWKENDVSYARVIASYTMKENTAYQKTFQEYLLRQDADSLWKIIGFREADTNELN